MLGDSKTPKQKARPDCKKVLFVSDFLLPNSLPTISNYLILPKFLIILEWTEKANLFFEASFLCLHQLCLHMHMFSPNNLHIQDKRYVDRNGNNTYREFEQI